jgi:hypothetical protein
MPKVSFQSPSRPRAVPYDLGGGPWAVSAPQPPPANLRLVADAEVTAGLPASFDLAQYVARVYDQGTTPACVCFSAAAMQSIYSKIEQGTWMAFDALECYHTVGGDDSNGVDTTSVLAFMQSTGLLAAGTVHRYRIKSFRAVPLGPAGELDQVRAAVAKNRPVVLSMLLPADWGQGAGQSDGGDVSGSPHQVCVTGYDADRLYFVNSQGTAWGDQGFGSIPASFVLRPEQDGWCFAYTTVDSPDGSGGGT